MKKRPYHQTARAEAAERTRRAVVEAATALWRERVDLDQVTLDEIAERAGVTRQTVLRKFGSKEGLLDAALEEGASDITELRDGAPAGDVPGAIAVLTDHYERDHEPVLMTLAIEHRSTTAARIVARGRADHRAWCARVFESFLPGPRAKSYDARLDAFVAATDLYVWKLLRLDLGRSAAETRETMTTLVEALASSSASRR